MGTIRKKYWRSKQTADFDFMNAYSKHAQTDFHFHHGFTVSAVETGSLPMFFTGFRTVLKPGDLLLMGPDVPHTFDRAAGDWACNYRTMTYPGASRYAELERVFAAERNAICVIRNRAGWRDFLRVMGDAEQGGEHATRAMGQIFCDLLSNVSRNLTWRFHVQNPRIRKARSYLDENYATPPDIEVLSSATSLSSRHFIRLFKSEMGMTPHRYINQLRINAARRMIGKGGSLIWIAHELGFSDQSHFSKTFSKLLGVSPLRYLSGGVAEN